MRIFPTFANARERYEDAFLSPLANIVKAARWQGVDISDKPEMVTRELLGQSLQVPLRGIEDCNYWAVDTKANLPWANVHFEERVGGEPLNPGESWKSWPWGHSADKFRTYGGQFSHTYMERFWPKYAGKYEKQRERIRNLDYRKPSDRDGLESDFDTDYVPHKGIRFEYGDLHDLVTHLQEDPFTRQAYLPVWFPEDGTCGGRKPCTLGYHFINRFDYLHVTYFIRSCDFVRHWGDDCYLTIRLLLWILDRLRGRDQRWGLVKPGMFTMHCVSLHMFENDHLKLRAKTANSKPNV